MIEVKFIEGTPMPDDYLASASQLVRDAALAIDMFGEDELEAAGRERASGDGPDAHTAQRRCCVCGEEIFDDESTLNTCEDCLDNVHRDPEAFIDWVFSGTECVLRTYAGFGRGDVDATHPTLEAAIEAFDATPVDSIPRVIRDGKTLVERDPEGGLAPVFWDGEAQRIYGRMVNRRATTPGPSNP